jgi:hypothetical protein
VAPEGVTEDAFSITLERGILKSTGEVNMKTWYINLYRLKREKQRGRRSTIHKVHCVTVRSDWNTFDWEYLDFTFPNTFMMNPDRHLERYKLSEFVRFCLDSPNFFKRMETYANKKSSHYNLPFLEGYHIPKNTFTK